MNIKNKLILGSSLLAAVPVILAGLFIESVATGTAKDALEKQIDNQLVSLREIKKNQIENYFNTISNQIKTFSNDEMIINAMQSFKPAFYRYREEALAGNIAASSPTTTLMTLPINTKAGITGKALTPGPCLITLTMMLWLCNTPTSKPITTLWVQKMH